MPQASSGPSGRGRLASLTPDERQILDLMCQGMRNPEIVDALGLTEDAVKNLMGRMLAKLG